jgi:hypothetical protein
MNMAQQTSSPLKIKVFISYSRKDKEFAKKLHQALLGRSYEAFRDEEDIVAGEPWPPRLGQLILRSDVVVCVVSPDLICSGICKWEAEEAARLSKRLLPLLWRAVDDDKVWPELSGINYIYFSPEHYPSLKSLLRLSTL